jgi:hypothetical protein
MGRVVKGPVLVVLHHRAWCDIPETMPSCPVPYRLSQDPADIRRANLLIFHVPNFDGSFPDVKPEGQLWVAWSMESQVNYPMLASPTLLRRFDLLMTYRRNADIWVPYLHPELLNAMRSKPRPKTEKAVAVYFASNPHTFSNREGYVRELMKHLAVDSFGKSQRNRKLPGLDRGRETKLETISQYHFTLAFENSVCPDYVTEKFYDPLEAGSVPVYLGAPNVADFAPAPKSYIAVSDFDRPARLADYLKHLAGDEKAYNAYTEWRSEPFARRFVSLAHKLREHALSRLLRLYLKRARTSC